MNESLSQRLEKAIDFAQGDIATLRTGRAIPSLVESILVDVYESKLKILELANISAPDPNTLVIQAWDKNVISNIKKAIQKSPLGLNPNVDGDIIRIVVPALTEERRNELLKGLNQKVEDARQTIRQIRQEEIKKIDQQEKNGEISEDEKFRLKKEVEEKVSKVVEEVEQIRDKKAGEIKGH